MPEVFTEVPGGNVFVEGHGAARGMAYGVSIGLAEFLFNVSGFGAGKLASAFDERKRARIV